MIYWQLDLAVIAMQLASTLTGLVVIHIHNHYFRQFNIFDVFRFRTEATLNASLYIANTLGTGVCLYSAVLRSLWLFDMGWGNDGPKWAVLWLSCHAAIAIFATSVHLATHLALRSGLCVVGAKDDADTV